MTHHPLTPALQRAREAAGALEALLLAEVRDVPDCDRLALRRVWARLAAELQAVPWAHPDVRRMAGRLAEVVEVSDE